MEFQYLKVSWKSSVPRARTMGKNGQVEGKLLTREMHKKQRVRRQHAQGFESSGVCTHSLGLKFGPAS